MRLTDPLKQALGYWWNLVTDAAKAGFTVTETVSMANTIAKDLGGSLSFQENTSISQLYGYARREVNAGNALTGADPDQAIGGTMISVPPYARDDTEQTTTPLYHVRVQYDYIGQDGKPGTGYITSIFNQDNLPDTVGELVDAIQTDAVSATRKYEQQLVSASPVNILAV